MNVRTRLCKHGDGYGNDDDACEGSHDGGENECVERSGKIEGE